MKVYTLSEKSNENEKLFGVRAADGLALNIAPNTREAEKIAMLKRGTEAFAPESVSSSGLDLPTHDIQRTWLMDDKLFVLSKLDRQIRPNVAAILLRAGAVHRERL